MNPKEWYEAVITAAARSESLIEWIVIRRWGPVGSFSLLMALCMGGYISSLKYYQHQNRQAASAQLTELRWTKLQNGYATATDAIDLCLSTPLKSKNHDWYCEIAQNRFIRSLDGARSPYIDEMVTKNAFPLIRLELAALTRNIAWERIAYAKPPLSEEIVEQLLRWSWGFFAGTISLGAFWLAYLDRYRTKKLKESDALPRLE